MPVPQNVITVPADAGATSTTPGPATTRATSTITTASRRGLQMATALRELAAPGDHKLVCRSGSQLLLEHPGIPDAERP